MKHPNYVLLLPLVLKSLLMLLTVTIINLLLKHAHKLETNFVLLLKTAHLYHSLQLLVVEYAQIQTDVLSRKKNVLQLNVEMLKLDHAPHTIVHFQVHSHHYATPLMLERNARDVLDPLTQLLLQLSLLS